ncbi:MAG: sarcosine oxidase subunit delta [Dongiaceae bacterium]
MKILNCPLNGPRNISEFVWGGEVKPLPDPTAISDLEWGAFVFLEDNTAGVVREWWCHVPTSFWFIAERNTVTDEFLRTYPASDLFKQRVDFKAPPKRAGDKPAGGAQ